MVRQLSILLWIGAALIALYIAEITFVESADVQTQIVITICGDGVLQDEFETCDEGSGGNLGGYASSTSLRQCAPGCQSFGPYCGDDVLQVRFGEACDDGNHTVGDLCNASCQSETAVPPGGSGSIPGVPGADPGQIPAATETRVVVRGKAYPGSEVNVLLDGKVLGTTRADTNADFFFSTNSVTPGTASFGFWARDKKGNQSITTSVIFEVVQSAATTIGNVFFPPTIAVNKADVEPGELLEISGQTIPEAKVVTEMYAGASERMEAKADAEGSWAVQIDTQSIPRGSHTAKSFFESASVRSGYGKLVSFSVGGATVGEGSSDINGDAKVNLVDFSIFLLSWGTANAASDFNGDGTVNLADFSILLFNWTG